MKRYLGAISAFFVFATATSAMAADFPAKAPQAPALIPVYDWTGIYVGGHIGGAWSTSSYNFAFAPSIACTVLPRDCFNAGGLKQSGVEGGAQAGFNYQVGQTVWGLEADISWLGGDSSAVFVNPDFPFSSTTFEQRTRWVATVRPRFGWAFDRALVYVTGGGAWGQVAQTENFVLVPPGSNFSFSQSSTRSGWTVGGGLEYALPGNWILRAEYLYIDLGSSTFSTPPITGSLSASTTNYDRERISEAHLGLSYKFNWGAPLAARY